jgi:hypothetical protein
MTLLISTMCGKTIDLPLTDGIATVADVRREVRGRAELSDCTLFKLGCEDQLRDRASLSDLGIGEGSRLFAVPLSCERTNLTLVYEAIARPDWVVFRLWLEQQNLSSWGGVRINPMNRVVSLDLSGARTISGGALPSSGPIPTAIGLLHSLEFLSLNNSGFGGALPPALGQLPALKSLCLQGNAFEGGLPPELGQLGELRVLKVSHNQLVGPLPRQLGGLRALNVLHIDSSALVAAPSGPGSVYRYGNREATQAFLGALAGKGDGGAGAGGGGGAGGEQRPNATATAPATAAAGAAAGAAGATRVPGAETGGTEAQDADGALKKPDHADDGGGGGDNDNDGGGGGGGDKPGAQLLRCADAIRADYCAQCHVQATGKALNSAQAAGKAGR